MLSLMRMGEMSTPPPRQLPCAVTNKKRKKHQNHRYTGAGRKTSMSKQPNVVIVMARCSKTHQAYGMRFEEITPGNWLLDWAFAMKEDASRKEGYDQSTIAGGFGLDEEYPGCPHCGAGSLVKCGCGKVGCWDQKSDTFTCPWCHSTGRIGGTIDSLSAGGDR